MTALRQEAISIVESLPEEKISTLLNILHIMRDEFTEREKSLAMHKG